MLGTFGDVAFVTSPEKIRTWSQLSRQGKARWATHDVIAGKPLLQFVGQDLEEIKLQIRLDVRHGLNPINEINTLRAIRDTGEPQTLIIGGKPYGRFVLEGVDESHNYSDNRGNLLVAVVSLDLKEYVDRTAEPAYRLGLDAAAPLDAPAALAWVNPNNVPIELDEDVLGEVMPLADDFAGGMTEKFGTALSKIQEAGSLMRQGLDSDVVRSLSSALDRAGLDLPSVSDMVPTNPRGVMSLVTDKVGALPAGEARGVLDTVLGRDVGAVAQKYIGRAPDLMDAQRFTSGDWVPRVPVTETVIRTLPEVPGWRL